MRFSHKFFIKSLRRKKIVDLIIAAAFSLSAFFLLIILLTYSPYDPSFFYASSQAGVHNWCGFIGSYTAGFLLFLFGSAAIFLIPLLTAFAYFSWHSMNFKDNWDRIAAGLLIIIIC